MFKLGAITVGQSPRTQTTDDIIGIFQGRLEIWNGGVGWSDGGGYRQTGPTVIAPNLNITFSPFRLLYNVDSKSIAYYCQIKYAA